MWIDKSESQQFFDILRTESISPVYQPIVCLSSGEVYGYEALSRIKNPECQLTIDRLFSLANQIGQTSPLECLCRERSIEAASDKPRGSKLFLNIDANLICEPGFISGFTDDSLAKHGLVPGDIVFEITERSAVTDVITFEEAVDTYRKMGFHIAIDDVGAGYSGLNRICSTSPQYLKIDMSIIRNIHLDSFKISMVNGMCKFCQEMGIYLIAEGIETEDELRQIIKLGIPYGQGYFFKRPSNGFESLESEKCDLLHRLKYESTSTYHESSLFGCIESITEPGYSMTPGSRALEAFERFKSDLHLLEISVVDESGRFCGVLVRNAVLEVFAGRYGFSLNQRKLSRDLMNADALVVDSTTSVEIAAKVAITRSPMEAYHAVVVTKDDKYLGIVTIKSLLAAAIDLQVRRATDVNPLTELPGNMLIEEKIRESIDSAEFFALIYIDIDNFKAYNDAYGFKYGDKMIQSLVKSMKHCFSSDDFIGHIGGDDFIIITKIPDIRSRCQALIDYFKEATKQLYSETDWEKEHIITQNRSGITEKFPLATISIACVTNQNVRFEDIETLSKIIAEVKKRAKKIIGNSIIIDCFEKTAT